MMLATGLALVLAALPLGSTQYTNQDWRIKLYEYGTDQCGDDAIHPNGIELKAGTCVNLLAGSVTPHTVVDKHGDIKYDGWFDEVNHGNVECGLQLYGSSNCPKANASNVRLPNGLNDCAWVNGTPVQSVRFVCGFAFPEHIQHTHHVKSTFTWTSWTTSGPTPVPYTHKTVLTVISSDNSTGVVKRAQTTGELSVPDSRSTQSAAAVEHRNDATDAHDKHPNLVGVWLRHPWTYQWRCVACWLKHHGEFNGKFRCEQNVDVFAACGTPPSAIPTPTETVTELAIAFTPSPSKVTLEERGPKQYVWMRNPYNGRRVCVEAEYHQHGGGHPKGSLEIKGPKKDKKCKKDALALDFEGHKAVTETISRTTTFALSNEYITTVLSTPHPTPSDRGL